MSLGYYEPKICMINVMRLKRGYFGRLVQGLSVLWLRACIKSGDMGKNLQPILGAPICATGFLHTEVCFEPDLLLDKPARSTARSKALSPRSQPRRRSTQEKEHPRDPRSANR